MPTPYTVHLGGHNYTIAGESLLPRGKRGYIRKTRPVQDGDPDVPKVARWRLSGYFTHSREAADGVLGLDWATLETRYDDLLTSLGAVSTNSVATYDPITGSAAALGGFALGGAALGGGSSAATPATASHIRESNGKLFLGRGAYITMVDPSTWTTVATNTFSVIVRGMANWYSKLRIGMGAQKAIQTVTAISSTKFTTSDTQVSAADVFAKEMEVGDNRLWLVRADAAGTNENRVRFTQDDFVSMSTGFVVGDPGVGATAIGVMGPYTTVGGETGDWGFDVNGTSFTVNRALRDARSVDNGRKKAYAFGWQYVITSIGLYAQRANVSNPVGIGTDAMSGFEGFDGKPTAVLAWREALFCCYESSDGATWRILRGVFDPQLTDATGQLQWTMFAQRTTGSIKELAAVSQQATTTLPAIVWTDGASLLAHVYQGRGGRDIADSSYVFSTAGGIWYGMTMMRNQHLRKTVRWGRFFTENMASGNTWQLAVAFDGGAYSDVGSAATTAGAQKVVPSSLTSAPTGFTMKPRLTQVAGAGSSSATPPQLRGYLEIGYDERPETVIQCAIVIHCANRAEYTRLEALTDADDSTGRQPIEIRLPEDSTLRYGYVTNVEEQDLTTAGVIGAAVTVILVDAA